MTSENSPSWSSTAATEGPKNFQLECLFVISIELNVFGLVYIVTKKLASLYRSKEPEVPVFACEDASKSQSLRKKEHIVARG